MALSGVLWGVSSVVVRGAFLERVPPMALVQGRLFLSAAALALCLALAAPRLLLPRREDLPVLVVWGLFGLLAIQASYFWAVSLAGVAMAVFMQYLSPLLSALWARVVGKERLGAPLLIALALCLSGTAGLLLGEGGSLRLSGAALAAGALAAVSATFNTVFGKRVLRSVHPATAMLWGSAFAACATLAVRSPAQTWEELIPSHAGQLAYVAIGSTLVPFLLYFWGLSRLRPTNAIILAMLEPVVGVVGAWLVLGEGLTRAQWLGAALVLAGVIVVERRRASLSPTGGTSGLPEAGPAS